MTTVSSLSELLARDEGESLTVYQDTEGYWTISRGICVDSRVAGAGLLPEESSWIASNRQAKLEKAVEEALPWSIALSEPRQAVLVSMAYQMGLAGLLGFVNTLKAVKAGDWKKAAAGMKASKWARQTPERAARLALQMESGQWV